MDKIKLLLVCVSISLSACSEEPACKEVELDAFKFTLNSKVVIKSSLTQGCSGNIIGYKTDSCLPNYEPTYIIRVTCAQGSYIDMNVKESLITELQ